MRFQPHLQDGFEDREAMRHHAVQMRLDGLSRREIAAALGFATGGKTLSDWLRGVPPPEWTKRPNAKDDLREKAIAMRLQGMTYRDIGEALGVPKSTLSVWLKGLLLTPDQEAAIQRRGGDNRAKAAEMNKARRTAARSAEVARARGQITQLSESELFVAGVALYWAEGSKEKPWRTSTQVRFINSDPDVISLFLKFLELMGVEKRRLRFSLSIHESANLDEACRFWSDVVEADEGQWLAPSLKRHNPKTVRRNTADAYHGCLCIRVKRSSSLYRQIAGWFEGISNAAKAELNHRYNGERFPG